MQQTLKYPNSPRVDRVDNLHSHPIPDPYRWLEEIDSGQTKEWIGAQNELTFDFLAKIPAREEIRQRLTQLWDYEKFGIPFKRNGRYFFTYNDGLKDQSILYWSTDLDVEPQLLLDPNTLSSDGTIALTSYDISNDGTMLVYGLSTSGSDWQEYRVRNVDTGRDLDDHIQWVKFSGPSWDNDGEGFFYSRYDVPEEGSEYKGANYHHKLYYHRIGTAQSADRLIYARPDHKDWNFGAGVSDDGNYLILYVSKGTLRENGLFYLPLEKLDDPDVQSAFVELLPDFDASYGYVGNDESTFYVLTDNAAPLSRLIAIDTATLAHDGSLADACSEIIPETDHVLRDVSYMNQIFVANYLRNAQSHIDVLDNAGKLIRSVSLPGVGSVGGFHSDSSDTETFYSFTSFSTPGAIYRYDLQTGESSLVRQPILGFSPEEFVTEQVFYESKDGTRVSMFLSYKKGLRRNGQNPTYLYGYGGFNIPLTPSFSVSNLVWMERGGICAYANLRGGGEYGKEWHQAGTKLQKQNVFDDFIAAAEWLIEQEYTSTPRLAISGGSNGGLLVGACMTQRPDLFGACLAAVGVLDMLRFHEFTIGWAWTSDYGSPENAEEFAALLAYSPYHNLRAGTAYPPTLITTGDHDDRVFPGHSFKFAAALQAAQGGDAPTLIRIEPNAGHGAGKPTSKLIREATDRWAFLVDALDME